MGGCGRLAHRSSRFMASASTVSFAISPMRLPTSVRSHQSWHQSRSRGNRMNLCPRGTRLIVNGNLSTFEGKMFCKMFSAVVFITTSKRDLCF